MTFCNIANFGAWAVAISANQLSRVSHFRYRVGLAVFMSGEPIQGKEGIKADQGSSLGSGRSH